MSDPENFMARWSRRKRAITDQPGDSERSRSTTSDPQTPGTAAADAGREATSGPAATADVPFDLGRLPSIESITADTDIRAFFAPGVPAELRLAALRRAWVADPRIRDFVGLNDYDWDFHTPGAIPGFGPLEMTDELRREVARIVGTLVAERDPADANLDPGPVSAAPPAQTAALADEIGIAAEPSGTAAACGSLPPSQQESPAETPAAQPGKVLVATQQVVPLRESLQVPARRSHGGALPK